MPRMACTPMSAARGPQRGQSCEVARWLETRGWPVTAASRHGPSPRSYCSWSTCTATSEEAATVSVRLRRRRRVTLAQSQAGTTSTARSTTFCRVGVSSPICIRSWLTWAKNDADGGVVSMGRALPLTRGDATLITDAGITDRAQVLTDVAEDAGEQPGDLHLGDPQVLGDLALGQSLEEPQLQDAPITLTQPSYDGGQHDSCFGGRLVPVLVPDELAERSALLLTDRLVQ